MGCSEMIIIIQHIVYDIITLYCVSFRYLVRGLLYPDNENENYFFTICIFHFLF